MRHLVLGTVLMLGCLTMLRCEDTPRPDAGDQDSQRVHAAGLTNVLRVTDKLLSGGGPQGEAGFRSLQKLGVRTVISVDGARPAVELARRYGMRYVHLPVGYDGVPREQGLRLARAVRDLPGLIYLHCHHGKHRGPAAAAVVRRCLDPGCTADAALALLKRAGTDPKYVGLYAATREWRHPTAGELDGVDASFPEVARVGGMMQRMVQIDERWEHLKQVRAAGWRAPPDHPDLDPAHEALMLWEHYVETGRLPGLEKRPEEFRRLLREAETSAKDLERHLREGAGKGGRVATDLDSSFRRAEVACAHCHARYRDVPQK